LSFAHVIAPLFGRSTSIVAFRSVRIDSMASGCRIDHG
jgi:hypothetical protein